MKTSLLIAGLSVTLFFDSNAMQPKNKPSLNNLKSETQSKPLFRKLNPEKETHETNTQDVCKWDFDKSSMPWFKKWKTIPVIKYELKNPTFSVTLVPEWHQLVLQNRIFWEGIDLRKPKYQNITIYAPLHIRYNTPSNKIMNSLFASFRPQEITRKEGHITVLD